MPNPLPILTVIIVAYKSRPEIGACLESLPEKIGDRAVESVVVDNFPGDGTSDFVRMAFPNTLVIVPPDNVVSVMTLPPAAPCRTPGAAWPG